MALKYEDIKKEFQDAVNNDKVASKLYAQIRNGDASYATSGQLAQRIGADLGKVLMKHAPVQSIDEWDVDDLIPKALGLDHRMVVTACKQVQENMNKDAKVGIKYKEPEFNMDKAQGIVKELRDNPEFTNIEKTFYDQLENFSRSVADDSIVANAGVMWGAGIKTMVVRIAEGGCCKWCSEMAGAYNYADVKEPGNDVWRRHENCNCIIDFYTERNGEVQRERVKEETTDKEYNNDQPHSETAGNNASERNLNDSITDKPVIQITTASIERVPLINVMNDSSLSEKIHDINQSILEKSMKENGNKEVAAVFTLDNKNIGFCKGSEKDLILSDDADKVLRMGRPSIVLHNHPRGGKFSFNDIGLFLDNDALVGIGYISNSGSNGQVLSKTSTYDRKNAIITFTREFKKVSSTNSDSEKTKAVYRAIEKLRKAGQFELWQR